MALVLTIRGVRTRSAPRTIGPAVASRAPGANRGDDGWLLAAGRCFVHLREDGSTRTLAEVARAVA
jgi:hypothetical protein